MEANSRLGQPVVKFCAAFECLACVTQPINKKRQRNDIYGKGDMVRILQARRKRALAWFSNLVFFSGLQHCICAIWLNSVIVSPNRLRRIISRNGSEPRHDKMCLREFPTKPDTNRHAQPQKLAEISAIDSRDIILPKRMRRLICGFVVRI